MDTITHTHDGPDPHAPRPDHDDTLTHHKMLEIAVRELLIEKGILTADEVREAIERMDARGPHLGAKVVAKAWEQIDRISVRAPRSAKVALVAGAGPIGMLASLLGIQRGYQVHVFDRVADGLKPSLVAALGATYHRGSVRDLGLRPDVILECAGAAELVMELARRVTQAGVICLIGISSEQRRDLVNVNRVHASMVLEWLRRSDPTLSKHLKTYLFTEGSVTEIETEVEHAGGSGDSGDGMSSDGSLGIGSLRPAKEQVSK